ncbi:MAG: prepilin peptidase [Gemmatimonadales bacterium]
MTPPTASLIVVAVFGLLIGSFLNVCIVRWPALQSVVAPRSRCPQCGGAIAWYDNVPVVSWLALRARCRRCGLGIPWRYPAVELATGAIWVAAFAAYGFGLEALRGAVFGSILLGIAVSDAREYIIPDEFSIGGTAIGLLLAFAAGWNGHPADPRVLPWPQAVLGAAVGFGLLWLVAVGGAKAFGKEAMGGGDVKMMAMIGAFLGWEGVLLTLFFGAVLGTVVFLPLKLAGRDRLVPFGVFLAVAAAACWIGGADVLNWYRGLL